MYILEKNRIFGISRMIRGSRPNVRESLIGQTYKISNPSEPDPGQMCPTYTSHLKSSKLNLAQNI